MLEHHAYIYEGPLAHLGALAEYARGQFGYVGENNPDVHVREFEKFGIDEARALTELAAFKSSAGKALFVVGVSGMTSESQQALLKLFEEPPKGAVFVLLAPHGLLLPTLRSRTLPYPDSKGNPWIIQGLPLERSQEFKKFLKASQKDRSTQITALLKDDEGVKERVRELLDGLEQELMGKITSAEVRAALRDIGMARDYLRDRSPSIKMLLEHLALVVPTS